MSGTIISGLFDLFRPSARAAGSGAASGNAAPGAFDAMLEGFTAADPAIGAATAVPSSKSLVTPLVVTSGHEETAEVPPAPTPSTAALLSGSAYQSLSAPVLSTFTGASASPDASSSNLPASVGTPVNNPQQSLTSVPPALTQDDQRNSKTGRLSSSPLPTPQGASDDMSLAAGTQEAEGAQVAAPAPLSTTAPATGAEAEHLGKMPTMYIDSPFSGQIIQRGIAQGATTRPAGLASWTDMPILLQSGEETTVASKTALADTAIDSASVDDKSIEDAPVDGNNAPAQDMFAMQPPLQFQMQIQAQLQPQPPLPVQTVAPEQAATASTSVSTQTGIAGIGETKSVGKTSAVGSSAPLPRVKGEVLEQAATPDQTPDAALAQLAAQLQTPAQAGQPVSAPVPTEIKGQGRASASPRVAGQVQSPVQAAGSDVPATQDATAPLYAGTIDPTAGRSLSSKGNEAPVFQMQVRPQARASVDPSVQTQAQPQTQPPVQTVAQGQTPSVLPEEASVTTPAEAVAPTGTVTTANVGVENARVETGPVRKGGKPSISTAQAQIKAQIQPQTAVQAQVQAPAQTATPDQPVAAKTATANTAGDVRVTGKSARAQARQAAALNLSNASALPVTDSVSQEVQATGEGPARMAMTSLAARLQSGAQASSISPAKIAPGAAGEATALLSMIDAGRGGNAGSSADSHAGKGSKSGTDALFSVATPDAAAASGAAALPTSFGRIDVPVAAPVADVGATLGQQVIDMSSGGQWIDGLAREIASLSAGTGQGSFRLSPEHLGPMRVDIRPGEQGSAVTLTVETKAAETALTKDKSSLQADAHLSGVGIAEVKIERVASVAETSRSETPQNSGGNSGNSQNPQSQAQQHQQQAALAQGNNGQGAGNGHQARKVFNDNAVSNGSESNERGAKRGSDEGPRARYA